MIKSIASICFATVVLISGCSNQGTDEIMEKELVIYCGITMIRPMAQIASMIEKEKGCKIKIIKGGSGNLLKSILHNKVGDMYLPGSEKYFEIIDRKHQGLVTHKTFVGYNRAVLMVQKGNPLNLPGDLNILTNKELVVVIGDPDSGSIGKETKKILDRKGIFREVVENSSKLTTDSKDLARTIVEKEADVVINWYAVSTWDNTQDYIDALDIDAKYAKKKKLLIGKLKYTKYPEIVDRFIELASSDQGRKIFSKHGF